MFGVGKREESTDCGGEGRGKGRRGEGSRGRGKGLGGGGGSSLHPYKFKGWLNNAKRL